MIFDINHVVLELNGHTVQDGYSDDADAIMFEPITLVADSRVGAGGKKAYFGNADRGTSFTLKLLPNSPDVPFFQQQAEIVRQGGSVIWQGSVRDTQGGHSVALRNGVLRQYPPFPNYGANTVSNYEYVFEFEEIVPDYDAVNAAVFAA